MDASLLAATVLGAICAGLGMIVLTTRIRSRPSMVVAQREVTLVACDLPGFSAYAEAVPSRAVDGLLAEYHAAVGRAVAEVDGRVEDVTDDAILVLVGAPPARVDPASAALALARRIHEVTVPVIERWSTGPHPLGIGVGVGRGLMTVGAGGGGFVLASGRELEPVRDGRARAYRGATPPLSGQF